MQPNPIAAGGAGPQPEAGVRAGISARTLTMLGLSQLSNAGLAQDLTRRLADEPAARLVLPAGPGPGLLPHVGLVRHDESEDLFRRLAPFGGPSAGDGPEMPAGSDSLFAHVAAQLPLIFRQPVERVVAERFAEAIEPSGWLGTTVEAVAGLSACPVEEAERILRKLQLGVEPAGLFARSLAECLRLQAEEAGKSDPVMQAVLDNLPMLAAGRHGRLAELCGVPAGQIADRLAILRRFDPKPGARFDHQTAAIRCFGPDLVLRRQGSGWSLELCGETLPRLGIAADARDPAAMRNVQWWIDALDRRNRRLLDVARHVAGQQIAYLSGAAAAPLPLAMGEVATATGVHVSGVSRIAAAATLRAPRGLVSLRALMPGRSAARADLSTAALRGLLRRMLADEPPGRPRSDARIAADLALQGIVISGRAVAQHRAAMGLGSSRARRRNPG
ncbi:MAG: RNA polymerase sigma-54 factor [Rhodobacteraceae bacterium]|jgi:RNA polymerase sigma-54 factor|nr:RNA polymerase sigma-54 factor [Paracoccaceae bacterium]